MNQEYTEDKRVKLKKISSGRRLLEAVLLVIAICAVYLMVALMSFNPSDPSWSQTSWHEPVHNWGGSVGAWLSDTLFSAFGIFAYAVPPLMFLGCWNAFRQKDRQEYVDFVILALRVIGALALILTSCGLAALNIDDFDQFSAGGVIGNLFSSAILLRFNLLGTTLVLLGFWAVGFTLFTGWSWLTIAEKMGAVILDALSFVVNRGRHDAEYTSENTFDSEHSAREQTQTEQGDIHDTNKSVGATEKSDTDDDDVLLTVPTVVELANTAAELQPTAASLAMEETVISSPAVDQPELQSREEEHGEAGHQEQEPIRYSFEVSDQGASDTHVKADNVSQPILHSPVEINTQSHAVFTLVPNNEENLKNVAANLASPVVTTRNPQVKQGIGPEMPRPNPVRIPTRRELYGIKVPSHRLAEYRQREEKERQNEQLAEANEQQMDAQQQDMLRQQFLDQQRERYGTHFAEETRERGEEKTVIHQQPTATEFTTNSVNEQKAEQPRVAIDKQLIDEPIDQQKAQEEALRIAFEQQQRERYQMYRPASSVQILTPDEQSDAQSFPQANHLDEPEPVEFASGSPSQPVQEQNQNIAAAFDSHDLKSQQPPQDSLFHPFLIRNDQPLPKPTTPMPSLDLLAAPPAEEEPVDMFALEQTSRLIEARLNDYRVKADVVGFSPGPVITRFELDLAPGVKASRISNLSRDLARSLSAVAVRIVEVVPGKPYVGLELPNKKRQTVYLREVLDCEKFRDNPSPLTIVLGKDIAGQPVVADLGKMPHLLVAGTTGSGKSVGVNAMILSILYKAKPEDVRFIMIDPKMLELSVYGGIPHLLTEVVTDMKDAANALRWCVNEMERRYKLMSALGVRNIAGYNDKIKQAENMGRPIPDPFWKPGDSMEVTHPVLKKEPYIVVMVDEFADLMMTVGKKVEELIARLAQKARAAGIHLVLATQRPSVDIITGLIKANIPTRIAFTVSSKIDSRTILDQGGAESLLGMGDMLYLAPNSSIPVRVHGAFVRDQEVHEVVNDWKARGRPQYIDSIVKGGEDGEGNLGFDSEEELDPLFDQAVEFVIEKRRVSISGVQRQFRIGYNRAARIVEQMEAQQIVSSPGHNGNREVLAPPPHEH